jgi:hypothetical protein
MLDVLAIEGLGHRNHRNSNPAFIFLWAYLKDSAYRNKPA